MKVTPRMVVLTLMAVFVAGVWAGTVSTPATVPFVPVPQPITVTCPDR